MARYNEILAGRFNRGIQKLLSLKGPPPAPQLSTDIQTVVPLPLATEYRYLDGWEIFWGSASVAAVAAQFNGIRLRNPVKSGIVGIVEKLEITDVTATSFVTLQVLQVQTDLPTVVSLAASRLDARGRTAPNLIFSTDNNRPSALVGPNFVVTLQAAAVPREVILDVLHEIPILPGDGLNITEGTANQTQRFSLRWRERVLEDSEVT